MRSTQVCIPATTCLFPMKDILVYYSCYHGFFLQSISSRGHMYHNAHDFPGLVTNFTELVNVFNLALETEHFWSTIKSICVFSQSLGNHNPQRCVTCSNMCM